MQLKNSDTDYGVVNKLVHWGLAIAILAMIPFGWYMSDLEPTPDKFKFYALHKSIGISILAVVAFRIIWRLIMGVPKPLDSHQQWEKRLSKTAHILLYVAIFVMPFSGWLMSSASGFPVSVFGLFTMPDLISKNRDLFPVIEFIHSKTAWLIIVLVSLHVLGALKHHFMDKDRTLRRMLPMFMLGAIIVLSPMSQAVAQNQTPQKWDIVDDKSRLAFIATWDTANIEGVFHQFDGDIAFDRNDLENSYARIIINMESFDTGYPERDVEIASQFWFDVDNHPSAVFETTSITQEGESYVAEGTLTIKDQKQPIRFPFTLTFDGDDKAQMSGEVTLQRLNYNVGLGQWEETDVIANDVKVKIDLAVTLKDKVH